MHKHQLPAPACCEHTTAAKSMPPSPPLPTRKVKPRIGLPTDPHMERYLDALRGGGMKGAGRKFRGLCARGMLEAEEEVVVAVGEVWPAVSPVPESATSTSREPTHDGVNTYANTPEMVEQLESRPKSRSKPQWNVNDPQWTELSIGLKTQRKKFTADIVDSDAGRPSFDYAEEVLDLWADGSSPDAHEEGKAAWREQDWKVNEGRKQAFEAAAQAVKSVEKCVWNDWEEDINGKLASLGVTGEGDVGERDDGRDECSILGLIFTPDTEDSWDDTDGAFLGGGLDRVLMSPFDEIEKPDTTLADSILLKTESGEVGTESSSEKNTNPLRISSLFKEGKFKTSFLSSHISSRGTDPGWWGNPFSSRTALDSVSLDRLADSILDEEEREWLKAVAREWETQPCGQHEPLVLPFRADEPNPIPTDRHVWFLRTPYDL